MQSIATVAQTIQTTTQRRDPEAVKGGPDWRPRIERAKLSQLDASHPGVKRAVDAAYEWRDRYVGSRGRDNDNLPGRAPSLVLSGPNGVGKTHIARAILWSVVAYPVDGNGEVLPMTVFPAGRWYAANDLVMKLAPSQTDWGTVEQSPVSALIGAAPLVVVDDLGGEGTIPFVSADNQPFERQARWFRFIDYCYSNDVPVIITTNLDIQNGALAGWVGPRSWDRLNEMAPVGQMVGMWDVPSWRVKTGGR